MHRSRLALVASLCLGWIACQTPPPEPRDPALDERAVRGETRLALQNGRALRAEGRFEAAERVLRRGLSLDPQNAKLERELAHALDGQGRDQDAREARRRADAIDPPPPPLPRSPTSTAAGRTLVVLVESTAERRLEEPGTWPGDDVTDALERRMGTRLPGAELRRANPESVADAYRWLADQNVRRALSLRVDRADCRFSIKDGEIAVVTLRVAAAARDTDTPPVGRVKVVIDDPPHDDCLEEAVDRAFEAALATRTWQAVAKRGTGLAVRPWNESRLRPLFPGLDRRIERELARGRALLRAGQLEKAKEAFREAARIDPDDLQVRDHLEDTEQSLALAREIALRTNGSGEAGTVDPRLSPSQRAAAQVALARERHRRQELLATLAVLDEDLQAPAATLLAGLRPLEISHPREFGPTLARQRAGGRIEARAAYTPDGEVLARYYFAAGGQEPLLREEDTNGDGHADRWITYREATRSEIFEDALGRGRPDRRLAFAPGGDPLEVVELDTTGDERPERVFRYEGGRLAVAESDTNGDGHLDRFDHFGDGGEIRLREEDLDGDGNIDVRSSFEAGKLVRRELFELPDDEAP